MGRRVRATTMCEACLRRRAQDGSRICRLCELDLWNRLGRQQAICNDLTTTFTRQAKLDQPPEAGRSANQPLPFSPMAGELITKQHALLVKWTLRVPAGQPITGPYCSHKCQHDTCAQIWLSRRPARTVGQMARWLQGHTPEWRLLEDVAQMAVAFGDLAARAAEIVDHPLMKAVAIGRCPNPVGEHEDQPCPGIVKAFIPLDGTDREASIKCTRGHEWAGNQRRSLARRLRQTGRLLV